MIDIHNHILHGLDDGPKDFETSVALARAAIDNGITHLVCTPHANDRYPFDPDVNAGKLAALADCIGSELTLGLGSDFHLSFDMIEDEFRNPAKYTINGKQYLLVEFPEHFVPNQMSDLFFRMKVKGIVPIITHPERNTILSVHPEEMEPWLRSGYLIQLTAGSILGRFGKRAEAICHTMLEKDWIHIIASDAHSLTSRPFLLREAHARVAKLYGVETADRLCIHNPRAVFYGEPLPPQPEPETFLGDTAPKGFLAKLFSR
jgi:protein-tyrosine phosphatase